MCDKNTIISLRTDFNMADFFEFSLLLELQ